MADSLVTVASFQVLPEAEAARMRLEAEGIHVFLANAEIVNMDWLLGNPVGYIKLQVPQGQAEAADAILDTMRQEREQPREESLDGPEELSCLECGTPMPPSSATCPACGWSYSDEKAEGIQLVGHHREERTTPEPDQAESVMDSLRAMRRPVLWLFLLWPVVVLAVIIILIRLALLL